MYDIKGKAREDGVLRLQDESVPRLLDDSTPRLPYELLYDVLDIAEAEEDHLTLRALALTCHTLRAPSQRRLFRRIHLSRSRPRRLQKRGEWELGPCRRLCDALESTPALGTYVEELYLGGGGLLCMEPNVPSIMHACTAVQTFSVEFFVCNEKEYSLVEWADVPPAFKGGIVALLSLPSLTALELAVASFPMGLLRLCQNLHDVVWRAIPGNRSRTLIFGFPEEIPPDAPLYQCEVKSILLQNLSHEFQAIEDFTITETPPFDISNVEVMKLHIDRYSAPVTTMIMPVSHSLRELELVLSSGAMKYDLEQVCFRLRDFPALESLLVSLSIESTSYTSTRPIPWLSYIFSGAPNHTALRQVVIHTYLTVHSSSMWPGLAMPLNLLEFPTDEYIILDEALQSVAAASLQTVRFLTAVERRDSTGVARRDWMPAQEVENLVKTKMPKAYSRGVIIFDSPNGH